MTDTNFNGYGTDDACGSAGYNSPGYQSSGYVNGTGYGSTDATGYKQTGYTPPDTWASGYQENVYDRANLLDTPYLDTAANPNPGGGAIFDPYGSNSQGYEPPQPLPEPKQNKSQSSFNYKPYHSNTFELEL